eukprot:gene117-47997_t
MAHGGKSKEGSKGADGGDGERPPLPPSLLPQCAAAAGGGDMAHAQLAALTTRRRDTDG